MSDIRRKCRREACAAVNVFRHRPGNSVQWKIVLAVMLAVWAVIQVGTTFSGYTPPTWVETLTTVLLGYLGGRLHEAENRHLSEKNEGRRGES